MHTGNQYRMVSNLKGTATGIKINARRSRASDKPNSFFIDQVIPKAGFAAIQTNEQLAFSVNYYTLKYGDAA